MILMKDKIYIEEICIGEHCGGCFDLFRIESLYDEIIKDIYTEEQERASWSKEDEEAFGEFCYSLDNYFPITITYGDNFDAPLHEIVINKSDDYKEVIQKCLGEIYQ